MKVLLKLDLVCAAVYHSVYCSVVCKQPRQSRQLLWQVINVGQEETGAKTDPCGTPDLTLEKLGTGAVDYNCLAPIVEEVRNPSFRTTHSMVLLLSE